METDRLLSHAPGLACRLALCLLLTLCLLSEAEGAEDGATDEPFLLPDTVLVEIAKLGLPLSEFTSPVVVIPFDRIRKAGCTEVRRLLADVPGLHLFDPSGSENQGFVESRGFTSFGETSYLQVLVDGFPISDLERDGIDWSLLGSSQLSRIEIMRGPGSSVHGNSSSAGVINLVSRRVSTGLGTWGEFSGGSHGEASATVGVGVGADARSGTISIVRRRRDGYRDHSSGAVTGAYAIFDSRVSPIWSIRARLLAHHSRREFPGPLPDSLRSEQRRTTWAPFRNDDQTQDLLLPSIELTGRLGPDLEAVTLLSVDVRDIEATETIYPVGALDRRTKSRGLIGEARLHWRPGSQRGLATFLGSTIGRGNLESRYREQGVHSDIPVASADVDRTTAALFGWVQADLAKSWSLTGGMRFDWQRSTKADPIDPSQAKASQEVSALSPNVGINWELEGRGNVFASVAGSFKAPTLEQLHDPRPFDLDGPGEMPALVLSSPALDPQRGVHIDAGARLLFPSKGRLEVGIYYAKSTDEIGFDAARLRYDNIEESTHFGFEGSAGLVVGPEAVGQIGYTFTRARFDGGINDGNQINGVPKHQVTISVDLEPIASVRVTPRVRHVRDAWLDEGNRFVLSDYTLVDVDVSQQFGPIRIFGAIENLTDERYEPTGYITIDSMGSDLPLYFPAAGRTGRLGFRIESQH